MQDHKIFAWRIGLVGTSKFLNSFKGIILLPILTKNLPIMDYGIWAQVMVTIGIIPNIVGLGLPETMVRFFPSLKIKDSVTKIFYSFLLVFIINGVFVSTIIYLLASPISSLLFGGNITAVKILSLVIFFETVVIILFNYLRVTEQIKKHSFLFCLRDFLLVVFVAFFVFRGGGINEALLGLLAKSIVICIIILFIVVYQIGISLPDISHLKEHLKYGLPMVPSTMSQWITNSSDRYIIGGFLGTGAVGYYSPGYTLGIIVQMFIEPLNFMLPMVLSRHYDAGDLNEVKKYLGFSLKYFLAIAIPTAFGISMLSKTFLLILSTPEIADQGYLITPFVAFGAVIFGTFSIFQKVLLLVKNTKIIGTVWVIAATINLILNLLLIPFIGIIAAAITTLFAFIVAFLIIYYYSTKHLNFSLNIKFTIKSVFSSLLMSIIIFLWNPEGLIETFIVIIICALFYFILLFLLKGFDKEELKFFKTMLSRQYT